MSVSTLEHNSAFAPAARRHRAVTSDGRKPSDGPRKVTASRRDSVMCLGRIVLELLAVKYLQSGVVGTALLFLKCMMRRARILVGERKGSPL
jgi:hypothetical protein